MPVPFDVNESAYTATAGNITIAIDTDVVDFSKFGTPDRTKINELLAVANMHLHRRRGVI